MSNLSKFKDTIEERHGLRGTHLNVPVSDLLEMIQSSFAPTDIAITSVNETNIQVPTHNYHLKTVIGGGEKTLYNFDKILDHSKYREDNTLITQNSLPITILSILWITAFYRRCLPGL